jgi:hypothetical protein
MQSIKLQSHVGRDGRLKIDVPTGLADVDLEVLVIIHPLATAPQARMPEERGWPPGFFEQTAGAWAGEPLVRGPQGEYEEREALVISEEQADYQARNE